MNKIIFTITLLWWNVTLGQVGVNTKNPQTTLDVEGNLRITKDFKVGGSETIQGDSGKFGEVLVSNGEGNAPKWSNLYQFESFKLLTDILSNINTKEVLIEQGETIFISRPINLKINNPSEVLINVVMLPIC